MLSLNHRVRMSVMGSLMLAILITLAASVCLLFAGGAVMSAVQEHQYGQGYFSYRINALARLPYWFFAVLVQLAFNGAMVTKVARLMGTGEFSPFRERGRVSWDVPVQYGVLFGYNLVLIVMLLFGYVIATIWNI